MRILLLVAGLLVAGCATPVGVQRADPHDLRLELARSILTGDEPSSRSRQLLDRLALEDTWDDAPADALEAIRSGLGGPDEPERLLGLAELSFALADRSRDSLWYRAAALAAYAYLFPEEGHAPPNAFDPGLRLAAELHNRGLALGLSSQARADLSVVESRWALPYGAITLTYDRSQLGWSGYVVTGAVPSSELRVRGLRNRYRRVGIGAPLSATVERVEGDAAGHRIGRQAKVPVTALLRFVRPREAVRTGEAEGALEVYVMDREKEVEIAGRTVPLEYEPTAALAFGLQNPELWSFELGGFFSGDLNPFAELEDGLVLLHPYRPGRVPVVLVHGTASTPGRWAELVNELLGDPTLADRIQIWLFLYNTGSPILYSGSQLREALRDTIAGLDPAGRDPALQQTVVVGHSQGGLLSKLLVVSSGDAFWRNFADRKPEALDLDRDTRELFSRTFFFEPLPFVRRVVYVATPHAGSFRARTWIAGWISSLITLPLDLTLRTAEVLTRNDDFRLRNRLDRMTTSIDNMRPGNRFLRALASLRERDGVRTHSIIAIDGEGPPAGQNDGVVTYESAHKPDAASERIVRSGHSVQGHPHAIEEVKRILYENLGELDAGLAEAGP